MNCLHKIINCSSFCFPVESDISSSEMPERTWYEFFRQCFASLASCFGSLFDVNGNSVRMDNLSSRIAMPLVETNVDPQVLKVPIDTPSLLPQFFEARVDIEAVVNFEDYLSPNEFINFEGKDCYTMDQPGLLVSTGTERSLFGLLQCIENGAPCEGLVIRDINPRVKAYMDFLILLFTLAEDIVQFQKLSSSIYPHTESGNAQFEERMVEIRRLLDANTTMLPLVREYYESNLPAIAKVYFKQSLRRDDWRRDPGFPPYHNTPVLFEGLKKYVMSGSIVTTVGNINDLDFLREKTISIVDVSNIPDYITIDLQSSAIDFCPKIVWTKLSVFSRNTTMYKSVRYEVMSKSDRDRMNYLLSILYRTGTLGQNSPISNLLLLGLKESRLPSSCCDFLLSSYNMNTLKILEEYVDENVMLEPIPIDFCFHRNNPLDKLSQEELTTLSHSPGIERFVEKLVGYWISLEPERFWTFSGVAGWKEAFIEQGRLERNNLPFRKFCEDSADFRRVFGSWESFCR